MTPARLQTPRKTDDSGDSRRRILDVASRLIAERGFSGTTISAIVERTGLPPTSIYWHFDSKEGLLAAVIEDGASRWFASLPRWEDLKGEPRARLARFFDAIAAALEADPAFLRLLLLLALERKHTDRPSLAAIRRIRRLAIERIAPAFEAVCMPLGSARARRLAGELATLALAFGDGCFLANHIDPDTTELSRSFALLRSLLLAHVDRLVEEKGRHHDE
jgi:AcrR family transcriptional regulator